MTRPTRILFVGWQGVPGDKAVVCRVARST